MGHFLQFSKLKSRLFQQPPLRTGGSVSPLCDWTGNRKYLTGAERRSFLRAAEKLSADAKTFCLTLAYTGARISEVLALTSHRVDFEARAVVFESLKKRRRGIYRAIPVPTTFLEEIDRVHQIRANRRDREVKDKALWTFGRTTAWKLVRQTMMSAAIEGPRTSPKALRHAFAVSALQAGVPITLVKKWLGHSRLSTTEIYADAVGDEEHAIASRFWDAF